MWVSFFVFLEGINDGPLGMFSYIVKQFSSALQLLS